MNSQFSRTELLLGAENIKKLNTARVIIFGIGGVGGYALEALARSGVGNFALVDNDKVDLSNINRQILALHSTIGQFKVDVAAQRIKDINPNCQIETYKTFYMPEFASQFNFEKYDYVIDAIDTVSAKISLACEAQKAQTPIISAMGAGNKLNPTLFAVSDIFKTSVCPLAKVMRKELKKRGIKTLKVVFSKEEPVKPNLENVENNENAQHIKRQIPGSIAFVPSVMGLIMAGEVVKDLIK